MNDIGKKFLLLLVAVLFIFTNPSFVFASEIYTIPILEEIELPQELDFTINHTCSGHAWFMQAAANESGCYAVYSRHVNPNDYSKVDFKRVYVDVYRPDGSFLTEVSFMTSSDLALGLEDNSVIIYFYDSILIYDLISQELHSYSIPEGSAVNGEIYKQLRSKEFTVGNWVYSYEKGFNGYVKLIRSNGPEVQVLVTMHGNDLLWRKVVLPGCVVGMIITIIIVQQIKRKQYRKRGSYEKDHHSF